MARRRSLVRRACLAALCATSATAGATARGAEESRRVREAPAAYALPEVDPASRFTAREPLVSNGLDRTIAKVAVDPTGTPRLVALLTPDLTPTGALELRRACSECIWRPSLGPGGEPVTGEITLLDSLRRNPLALHQQGERKRQEFRDQIDRPGQP